jgi:hypothetical protein
MSLGMIKKVTRAKVAVFTSALDIAQTETKGTVLIKNADEMLNFTTGEEKHLEKVGLLPLVPSFLSDDRPRSSKRSQMLVSRLLLLAQALANSHSTTLTASTSQSSKFFPNSNCDGYAVLSTPHHLRVLVHLPRRKLDLLMCLKRSRLAATE